MLMDDIVAFLAEIDHGEIPAKAVRAARRCMIDTIGVALAGSRQPEGKIITTFAREQQANPEATVVAGMFKTSAQLAALANGTLAHALDYDDVSVEFLGHPSTVLVPAVLALGESRQVSGADVLYSFIAGFEVGAAVGRAMGVQFFESVWHPTPVTGVIGAAAASAKMLGLNPHQVTMALGMAASMTGGLKENFGTMTKPLHAGKAASDGILAALLAEKGFTANPESLTGRRGLGKAFVGEELPDDLGKSLGTEWSIISPGVKVKRYPCCGGTLGCIDAILELRERHNIRPQDVAEVNCRANPSALEALIIDIPKTPQEGRFSLKYTAAVALVDGQVSFKQFTEEKLTSPLIQETMRKVQVTPFHAFGRGQDKPQEVILKLNDGIEYTLKVEKVRGTATNPLSDDELCEKFRDCACTVLHPDRAEKVLEMLQHLEELENIKDLMQVILAA